MRWGSSTQCDGPEVGVALATAEARGRCPGAVPDVEVWSPAPIRAELHGSVHQLYATAFTRCFFQALSATAARNRVGVAEARVTVRLGISGTVGAPALAVDIRVALPGVAPVTARRLVTVAERTCSFVKAGRQRGTVRARPVPDEAAARPDPLETASTCGQNPAQSNARTEVGGPAGGAGGRL